jgi:hypothetical protein
MRFLIRNTEDPAQKESDGTLIRFSGTGEYFSRVDEREAQKIGETASKDPIFKFNTGLDEDRIDFCNWFTDEEKKQVKKQIKELRKNIVKFYGGEEVVKDTNAYFWRDNREVYKLGVSSSSIDIFFDTEKSPVHALLYLSIVSGAFLSLVAPNKDWAEATGTLHYLALESDNNLDAGDETMTKMEAAGLLNDFRKEANHEALFLLGWCLQYDTSDFDAYGKNISIRDLSVLHGNYIDGKMHNKKKKNAAKLFIEYAEKWNASQTRPAIYAEAYLKAGEYFSYIQNKEKKFTTQEGTALGNTLNEALDNIMKPKYAADLEILRDKVEAKWKE